MLKIISTVILTGMTLFFIPTCLAEGEAGIISLRAQGHFYVGIDVSNPAENGSVKIKNQMYVGYQLPAVKKHPYPLVLLHAGGGQSTDWFSTPDERDGWRDYFLVAGYDVYWVDRPGHGRSPSNIEYGEITRDSNSKIITFLANSTHWPGNPNDHKDPGILSLLASSPPGPFGNDMVAARDISEVLERIGPAILLSHSAGSLSGWWAANLKPDKVAGIIAIEPGASNITTYAHTGLSFDPPLPVDFKATKDEENCYLQGKEVPSKLLTYKNIKVRLVGSELGLIAGLPCAMKAFAEAGVNVKYTFLPDIGFTGNGHYMMLETNNGELATAIMDIAAEFE